jgi:hypothetical protein
MQNGINNMIRDNGRTKNIKERKGNEIKGRKKTKGREGIDREMG